MSRHRLKARDKVTRKMTKDGLVERNMTTGGEQRLSKREAEFDLRSDGQDGELLSNTSTTSKQRLVGVKSRNSTQVQGANGTQSAQPALSQVGKRSKQANLRQAKSNNAFHVDKANAGKSDAIVKKNEPQTSEAELNKQNVPESQQKQALPNRNIDPTVRQSAPGKTPVIKLRHNKASKLHPKPNNTPEHAWEQKPTGVNTESALKHAPDADAQSPLKYEHAPRSPDNADQTISKPAPTTTNTIKTKKLTIRKFSGKTSVGAVKNQPANTKVLETPSTSAQRTVAEAGTSQPTTEKRPPQPISEERVPQNADRPVTESATAKQAAIPGSSKPVVEKPDGKQVINKPGKLRFTSAEAAPANKKSRKLVKAEKQADRAANKLDSAQKKLPVKRKIRAKRVFNESAAKPKTKLYFEKEVKSQGEYLKGSMPLRPVKAGANTAIAYGHRKMFQVEHENVGTEAAHKSEIVAEGGVRSALRFTKTAPYRKVAKLEQVTQKKSINLTYRQTLAQNPKLKSNVFSRWAQKRKIKKDYAKAAREAKKTAERVKKAGSITTDAAKIAASIVRSHPVATIVVLLLLLLVFFLVSFLGMFGGAGSGSVGAIVASSYQADDSDIDNAELAYTGWEADLQAQIANAERDHPGYDEYRYNIGDISHNPYELMAYLTAVYQNFTYSGIEADLQTLFGEQYQLSFVESVETKYRDPDDANGDGDKEPYEWHVLTVKLTTKSFGDVANSHMTDDQRQQYEILMETKGGRQYIANPFDFNWLSRVTGEYGWQINPSTGAKENHTGVTISVPSGTNISAGQEGTVSVGYDAGYGNYVTITGANGLVVKYGNLNGISVSNGQTVKMGDPIAMSGSSLYLEISRNGQFLNPLYFADTGDMGVGPVYGNPGVPMGDGSYTALITEAEKYLGFPYVWSGSSPSTSFDCSGFVCYVLNASGVANVGRTTAQGLYNLCTPISPTEAKPGDLVFFTNTYSSSNPVTHVGIFVGYVNGHPTMIAAGDPIQYTAIDTPYWISHMYSYGRLATN